MTPSAGHPPTAAPSTRGGRRVAIAVLCATVVGSALAAAIAFAVQQRARGPLLPVSWCRWDDGRALRPLTAVRLVTSWQLDAPAVLLAALAGATYLAGARRVRRAHPDHPWSRLRAVSFASGLGVVAIATCSGIGVYDMTQFWVHMIQHLLLIMVAPPLLVVGRPLTLALHATRNPWHTRIKRAARSRLVTAITAPPVVLALYALTIVGTHLTGVMGRVMRSTWLGQGEHLLYLASGYLFCVLLLGEEPIRWRLAMPARLGLVAMSMAVDTFVGVVLLQSTTPISMTAHGSWGLQPLLDTQMGGGIMWAGGDGLMVVLIGLVVAGWAQRPEHARRQSRSWLERARHAQLDQHLGAVPVAADRSPLAVATGDIDDDDASLAAYNSWLQHLSSSPPRRDP